MINEKKSRILYLFIVGSLLFLLCVSSNLDKRLNKTNSKNLTEIDKDDNTINFQTSGYWNLNNILIDDSLTGVGAHNWTWAVNQDWCSGAGTWINPYLIENVTIDALNSSSGIEIKNSNKYFIIRNVTVYNASVSASEAGISLYYVDNGMIISNNCSFNNGMGIFLKYCINNTVIGNVLHNNSDGISLLDSDKNIINNNTFSNNFNTGIIVQSCDEINVSENIVNNNSWVGMYIDNCDKNVIDNNTFNYNYYAGLRIDRSENNTISKNVANFNIEMGIMFWFNNTNNCVLENDIKFNQADGMILWLSDNNTIRGNTIKNNTQNGISLSFSDYNFITGNTVENSSVNWFGILIYNSTNNVIKENIVNNILGDGIYLENSINNTIVGNNATNNKGDGIYIASGSNNNTVKENTLDFNNQGIHLYGNINNEIEGNLIANSTWHGIYVEYSINSIIIENNVYNSLRSGIYLLQSNFSTISGNVATFNGQLGGYDGILLRETINNTVSQNFVQFNYDDGIGLNFDCTNNSILDNIVTDNGWAGIILYSNCDDNQLINNIIMDSSLHGIYLEDSSDNDIIGNRIEDNIVYGVYLMNLGCENNLFSYNFFFGNGRHAYDDGWYNNWNSSTIGNYWDNYTGTDTNNDGIGDIPYCLHPEWLPGWVINDSFPIYDTSLPVIDINSPNTNDLFGSSVPSYDIDITDHYLESFWYVVNGGSDNMISSTSGSIDQGLWNGFGSGSITITFYANDSLGQVGFAIVTIRKDITLPLVNIRSPDSDEIFGSSAPSFTVEIIEVNLDSLWYTLSGGTSIPFTSNGTIDQTVWDALSEGSVTIRFYALDLVGNSDFAEITIEKRLPGIPGYNLIVLITVVTIFIGFISLIFQKKRKNLKF